MSASATDFCCPRCASTFVQRVRRRWWERVEVMRSVSRPYRCWHCGWGGWLPEVPPIEQRVGQLFEHVVPGRRAMRAIVTAMLVVAGVAGLVALRRSAPAPHGKAESSVVDVTYSGVVPCIDCAGQRLVLTLFGDQSYRLRRTYLRTEAVTDQHRVESGRWERAEGHGQLTLQSEAGAGHRFEDVASDRLRIVSSGWKDVVARRDSELVRQSSVDPIADRVQMASAAPAK